MRLIPNTHVVGRQASVPRGLGQRTVDKGRPGVCPCASGVWFMLAPPRPARALSVVCRWKPYGLMTLCDVSLAAAYAAVKFLHAQ